jgi:hypothetical protein
MALTSIFPARAGFDPRVSAADLWIDPSVLAARSIGRRPEVVG